MLGEVISTAGPNHMNCCDSKNFIAKFNQSSPLSNGFKNPTIMHLVIKWHKVCELSMGHVSDILGHLIDKSTYLLTQKWLTASSYDSN